MADDGDSLAGNSARRMEGARPVALLAGSELWARARTGWEWRVDGRQPMPASRVPGLGEGGDVAQGAGRRRGSGWKCGAGLTSCRSAMPTPSSLEATRRHLPSVDLGDGDVGGDLVDELVVQVLWAVAVSPVCRKGPAIICRDPSYIRSSLDVMPVGR